MRDNIHRAIVFGALLSAAACGQSTFTGDSGQTNQRASADADPVVDASDEAAETDLGSTTPGDAEVTDANVDELLADDPNADAIKGCMANWGQTALTADAIKNYRTLSSTGTGMLSSAIEDRTTTKKPALVLIKSNVVGIGSARLLLGNAKGYYCLESRSTGLLSRQISKHCLAVIGSDQVDHVGLGDADISEFGDDCTHN